MNNLNITFGIIHCSSSPPPKKNKNFKLTKKKAFLCDDNHSFRLQKDIRKMVERYQGTSESIVSY